MSGLNRVILMGRLVRDPELKDANGVQIANFSLATSKKWKDDSGEQKEKTEWHNIVAFRKTAELVGKYLTKGRQVLVEGELQTRSWDDKDTGKKVYRTEIVANNLQFIGGNENGKATAGTTTGNGVGDGGHSDDIPF